MSHGGVACHSDPVATSEAPRPGPSRSGDGASARPPAPAVLEICPLPGQGLSMGRQVGQLPLDGGQYVELTDGSSRGICRRVKLERRGTILVTVVTPGVVERARQGCDAAAQGDQALAGGEFALDELVDVLVGEPLQRQRPERGGSGRCLGLGGKGRDLPRRRTRAPPARRSSQPRRVAGPAGCRPPGRRSTAGWRAAPAPYGRGTRVRSLVCSRYPDGSRTPQDPSARAG